MSDPSVALQTAVYSALDAALTTPVYDHVPQGAAYPYVTIDQISGFGADYLSDRKTQKTIYLSVWSTYRGQKEVQTIMGQISDAMYNAKLTLSTGRAVIFRVVSTDTNRDQDGVTYMGQVRINVLVEH